jgi:hypothetical protein
MAMQRFTLDTNCVIDVEEGRPNAAHIRMLVEQQRRGVIELAIPAIGASEKQRSGGYAATFSEFQDKLNRAGFDGVPLLLPMAYLDVCYFDHAILPSDEDLKREASIHSVLFPSIEFAWVDFAKARSLQINALDSKWRNAKCDVQALWCHVKGIRDVFVSSDLNFHAASKASPLGKLGAVRIALPADAALLSLKSTQVPFNALLERTRQG